MARRRHPAAKDPATGQFMGPWVVRGRRIYWLDPATNWAEPERDPWRWLRRIVGKIIGGGDHGRAA